MLGQWNEFTLGLYAIFFFSLVLHELAHAGVAYAFGDDTAKEEGRLSLNPLVHIDPVFTVFLPLVSLYYFGILFGGAKPVRINPEKMRSPVLGDLCTTLAGPAVHLLLALLFALSLPFLPYDSSVSALLAYSILFQVLLFCFNLLPIPPLDGGMVLRHLLPAPLARFWRDWLLPFGWIVLLLLVFSLAYFPQLGEKAMAGVEDLSWKIVEVVGSKEAYVQIRGYHQLRRTFQF